MIVASTSTGAVMVGFILSVTFTFWVAVAVLPEPSVTVHVTVVSPSWKAEGASLLTEATEQLSPVTGIPRLTPVAAQPVLVVASTSTGAVMVGFILSVTVTFWVAVAVLPEPSVTVHVTVVSPSWKAEGASLLTEATEQLSPVTGIPRLTPVAVQPVMIVASTSTGAVMVGFIYLLLLPSG